MPGTQPTGPRPTAQFKIMTGALKAFTRKDADGTDRRYLSCTASSSIKDLHGDEFTPECVSKMATTALSKGMTIFLNHKYAVPEDVFGATTASKAIIRTGDDGMPVTDMDLEVRLNESNPRATQAFDQIDKEGIKLGVSVGALINQWHPRDPNDTWGWDGMVIEDVELLEASIVGIPANQRSWVQHAVKSLRDAVSTMAAEEETDDTNQLVQMISDGAVIASVTVPAGTPVDADFAAGTLKAASDEVIDPAPISDDEKDGDPESAAKTATAEENTTVDPEQPPSDGAADAGTTGDSESTKDAPATGAVVLASSTVSDAFDLLVRGYRDEIESLRTQLSKATKERDLALSALKTATDIVDQIASLPLGRKTSFAQATSDFKQKFGGVYDDDFLQFLERTTP